MPAELAVLEDSWREHNPDWPIFTWAESNLDWLVNRELFDRAHEIVGPGEVGQLRADIARVEILHRFGGVYIDCDMECLRSFEPLLGVSCFAGFEDPERRWVNNAVLGAEVGHPFLAALMDALPASVAAAERAGVRRPNRFSGPQFVTPIWSNWFRGSVEVHPHTHFYPYSWSELDRRGEDFPDAWAVHHWHHRRSTRGTAR